MTDLSIQQAMELATAQHRAGQLAQAESLYRQILNHQPNNPNALHMLGLLYLQARHLEPALACIDRAIALEPAAAEFHLNRGVVLDDLNRTPEAAAAFRKALSLNPNLPEAHANLGNALRILGDLDAAAASCRRALELRPNYVEAQLNLANVLQDQQKLEEAVAAFQSIVAIRPDWPQAHHNLGNALFFLRRLDDAIAAQRAALNLNPNFPQAANSLGAALRDKAEEENNSALHDEALAFFRRAVDLKPDLLPALTNLARALRRQATLQMKSADLQTAPVSETPQAPPAATEAIALLRRALQLAPDAPDAHMELGLCAHLLSDWQTAIAEYRCALGLRPDWPEAHCFLGTAQSAAGDINEAIPAFNNALALNPNLAEAHHGLGLALSIQGNFDDALIHLRRAAELQPQSTEIITSLAIGLCNRGEIDQAAASFNRVLELDPNNALGHWNLALMLLTHGDFARGWKEYEWRWQVRELNMNFRSPAPLWDGSDLAGRTILLVAEQGFGDTIQFIRYFPQVAAKHGRIFLAVQDELRRLLQGIPPHTTDIARSVNWWVVNGQDLPPYDVYCPLITLPRVFGATLDNIPATVPYIFADENLAAQWKLRLPDDDRRKVGLAWAGRPKHLNDRHRSINASNMSSLSQATNVWFTTLQKTMTGSPAPLPFDMPDFTADLHDFADTAALIANLDLVITADTAVAHLAAAMAKPVWLLLPYLPDWRWLLNRADSPWYPTIRLFRQPSPGDWQIPIAQILHALNSPGE